MTKHGQIPCLLKSLANPNLSGVLTGLEITPDEVIPSESEFACCSGTGVKEDFEQNISVRCDLGNRLPRVKYLLARYHRQWGTDATCPSINLPRDFSCDLAERFGALASGTSIVGHTILTKNSTTSPSLIWPAALMAAWRFGLKPYVVNFSKDRKISLIPSKETRDDSDGMVVLVEHIDGLWDEAASHALDALVDWCYKALVPMWLNFVVRPSLKQKVPVRSFSRRIEVLKAKSPMDWFTDDRLLKLCELCEIPSSLKPPKKETSDKSGVFDIYS